MCKYFNIIFEGVLNLTFITQANLFLKLLRGSYEKGTMHINCNLKAFKIQSRVIDVILVFIRRNWGKSLNTNRNSYLLNINQSLSTTKSETKYCKFQQHDFQETKLTNHRRIFPKEINSSWLLQCFCTAPLNATAFCSLRVCVTHEVVWSCINNAYKS